MGEEDRLVRRLGAGHAGEVFEAVLEGKVYALKLVSKPAAQSPKHAIAKPLARRSRRVQKALTQNFPRRQTPLRLT